jgi:rubrerythrin
MSEISIGKEVLEMAIEIEKNGRSFYEFMARVGKEMEVRDMFTQLAAREQEHENTFRDVLKRLGGYRPSQAYAGEHYQYIRDLADSGVISGERVQAALVKRPVTDVEAIELGIGFEKDSILFYAEMRGMVPRQDQEIIDIITSEEKKHLSELTYIANKLRS